MYLDTERTPQMSVIPSENRGKNTDVPDLPEPATVPDPSAMDPEAWLALRPYRHRDYGPLLEPTVLAPARLFDPRRPDPHKKRTPQDAPQGTPRATALEGRLARMSCGWPKTATVNDFRNALRATKKEARHRSLLFSWLLETTRDEIADSLRNGTFTMRELATARTDKRTPASKFNS